MSGSTPVTRGEVVWTEVEVKPGGRPNSRCHCPRMWPARAAWPGEGARSSSCGPPLTALPAGGWEVLPGRGVGTACRRGPAWQPRHTAPRSVTSAAHDLSAAHPSLSLCHALPSTHPAPPRQLVWLRLGASPDPMPWCFPCHSPAALSRRWRVCRRWASLSSPVGPASASAGIMAVWFLLLPQPRVQGLAQGRQPVNVAPSDTGQPLPQVSRCLLPGPSSRWSCQSASSPSHRALMPAGWGEKWALWTRSDPPSQVSGALPM